MKFARTALLAAIAAATLASAGQAAAAGIQIDADGRQVAANTTGYGIAIDPNDRQGGRHATAHGVTTDPNGRAAGSILDPDGRGWLGSLLHRWFGWF